MHRISKHSQGKGGVEGSVFSGYYLCFLRLGALLLVHWSLQFNQRPDHHLWSRALDSDGKIRYNEKWVPSESCLGSPSEAEWGAESLGRDLECSRYASTFKEGGWHEFRDPHHLLGEEFGACLGGRPRTWWRLCLWVGWLCVYLKPDWFHHINTIEIMFIYNDWKLSDSTLKRW